MGKKGSKDFHFNVNVRTNTGSIARMANKEAEEQAVSIITPEPVENDQEGPTAEDAGSEDSSETPFTQQDEAAGSPETTAETPVTAKPASPKPSGRGVSGPKSRAGEFTPEELDAMRKRAKAHAANVKASKL
jgi:hypothetical protein